MSTFNAELRNRRKESGEAKSRPSIIVAVAKKQITLILQYKLDIVYWMVMPLIWLIPWILMASSIVGNQSPQFAEYTGSADYIGFLLIGSMLWATIDAALWGAGNSLRWEQQSGTLEYLWVSPTSRTDLLTGATLGEVSWVFMNVVGQFIIISIVFKWSLDFLTIAASFIAVVLTTIGMLGFGFAFSSLIMVFKEPGVLTELVDNMLFILSPVRYPIQGLPLALRFIAVVLPFTWGSTMIRKAILTNTSYMHLGFYLFLLLIIDAVFWIGGYTLFNKVERMTRKSGNLGNY